MGPLLPIIDLGNLQMTVELLKQRPSVNEYFKYQTIIDEPQQLFAIVLDSARVAFGVLDNITKFKFCPPIELKTQPAQVCLKL